MALHKSTEPPPLSPTHCYTQIPSQHGEGCVLPFYGHPATLFRCRWPVTTTVLLLLLSALVYVCWPSDPMVEVVRLRLNKIRIHTLPIINVDLSLYVTLKVRNLDVYSMDFTSLDVAVKYRGKRLGHVRSDHGHVRALGSSYVDAEIDLRGISVLSDVVSLLEDLGRGTVPFDTVTEVSGKLGLFFFGFPLKAKSSCEVLVNTHSQTIARQTCYPEVSRHCCLR
ncbi:LATE EMBRYOGENESIS ABUNDANT (LEA) HYDROXYPROLINE-RICH GLYCOPROTEIN FAMILY [Salix purpurea]|uniref:LATE EMBRYOGENESIS ABUNDANT (LEA) HYDROXYPROLINE-RICH GLYCOPROTEIN FAMILY n=1 Tax=Salix purpurea TaxID=77065 RepID=A0A9Q0QH42_SALPP|nr:LATE EMBRYOGENESIS ABUNDANT (LEA) HYDROXYPROLINE-RICH GLYCOPROTEIN FAMILY [Salix purpurea]